MGKRRRRAARTHERQFAVFSHNRFVDGIINEETARADQKKYLQKAGEIEQELLSRTVFVTNLIDLNQPGNLDKLRYFMESNFGKVERCIKDKFHNNRQGNNRHASFPPARITFATRRDAERIFAGRPLLGSVSKQITCATVGHRGWIRVMPSRRYDGMLESVLTGNSVSFESDGLSFGHWIPSRDDMYSNWREASHHNDWGSQVPADDKETFVEETKHPGPFSVCIDLYKRQMKISSSNFPSSLHSDDDNAFLKLLGAVATGAVTEVVTVSFKELRKHVSLCSDIRSGNCSLVFSTKWPPRLEREIGFGLEGKPARQTNFGSIPESVVGRCLGFKLSVARSSLSVILSHQICDKLRKFGVLPDSPLNPQDCLPVQTISLSAKLLTSLEIEMKDGLRDLARRSTRIASPCQVFRHLLMDTSEALSEDGPVAEDSIGAMTYCVKVHRVLLTPTQCRCVGLAMETGNRVLRRFTEDHGFTVTCFLRVRLSDENGTRLYSDQLSPTINTRIREAATRGLEINGDRYQLLAYSSSQLKECSFWMVKPKRGWSIEQIRADLGDFSKCTSTAKLAARIGQCFSATFRNERDGKDDKGFFKSIQNPKVLDDIKAGENKEKVHSDGTGLISRKLMDELLSGLPIAPVDVSAVSIIQIRYGGAKGTLSAWRHLDQLWFNGWLQVQLRKSMVKFEAKYRNIEVCSIGANRPYFLNRNLILLLRAHGVAEQVFLDIQQAMLDDMDAMLVNKEIAEKLLPALSGADQSISDAMMKMLKIGCEPSRDPFLYGCLQSIRLHNIYNLRKKARLYIEKGVVLMGGLDETGQVPEGCVYVHIYKTASTQRDTMRTSQILQGAVMVTKHPVMHPGDVRMLRAVDIPSLVDHTNVILFSRHGSRPEADKMAGSDLDGDEFAVTWDTRLFWNRWNSCPEKDRLEATVFDLGKSNRAPMDYDNKAATSTNTAVLVPSNPSHYSAAMIEHLINFMKNDNLGRIATLWLDYASRHGATCDQCIRLAELHSVAVDFAKSGVPAELPTDLLLPKDFVVAHWREKKGAEATMHCPSVIGKLYDEVVHCSKIILCKTAVAGRKVDKYGQILCARAVEHRTTSSSNDVYDSSIPSRLGFTSLPEAIKDRLISEAMSNRREFESELLMVANKYGIRSEGELFTGCVRKFHKLHSKKQSVIAEECRRACREVQRIHRRFFFETVLELALERDAHSACTVYDETDMDADKLYQLVMFADQSEPSVALRLIAFRLVAAYYMVTYNQDFSRHGQSLFAFPWILADVVSEGLMANQGT